MKDMMMCVCCNTLFLTFSKRVYGTRNDRLFRKVLLPSDEPTLHRTSKYMLCKVPRSRSSENSHVALAVIMPLLLHPDFRHSM